MEGFAPMKPGNRAMEEEMMKVRNLGRKSLEEVINKMETLGLSLKMEEE